MPSDSRSPFDPPARPPSLGEIQAAHMRIAGAAAWTPLVPSDLSGPPGVEILLKLESLQTTGAFKFRGAMNAVMSIDPQRAARGVACASTGNHGRAVAEAARRRGIRATVCVSSLVPAEKVRGIEAAGARVVRAGHSQDEAMAEVDRLVAEEGLAAVPPFDDAAVVAGQGTIALEILADRPDVTTIVVPLSGGGLAAGTALAAKGLRSDVRVIGVSMERGAAMAASIRAGRPVPVEEVPSLADSLGGGIGAANRLTFPVCRDLVDEIVLVSEDEIYDGMRWPLLRDKTVAEGACAVAHAALLAGKLPLPARGSVAFVITSRNVDPSHIAAVATGAPIRIGDLVVTGNGRA